jgi:hypothetical protein
VQAVEEDEPGGDADKGAGNFPDNLRLIYIHTLPRKTPAILNGERLFSA